MAGNSYPAHFNDANNVLTRWGGNLVFDSATNQPAAAQTTVRSYAFTYQTAGLASGVTIYTPAIGDVILDIGVVITTALNGTTPKIDVGTFNGGNVGLFGELTAGAIDATKVYADVTDNAGLATANAALWLSSAVITVGTAGTAAIKSWQMLCTAANPVLLVASQNGQKGGTAITSTAGVGTIYVVTSTPTSF